MYLPHRTRNTINVLAGNKMWGNDWIQIFVGTFCSHKLPYIILRLQGLVACIILSEFGYRCLYLWKILHFPTVRYRWAVIAFRLILFYVAYSLQGGNTLGTSTFSVYYVKVHQPYITRYKSLERHWSITLLISAFDIAKLHNNQEKQLVRSNCCNIF